MPPTTNERRTGILLILGALAMIITMSLHPHGAVAPAQLERMLRLSIAVHSFALLSLPLQFFAAWGLARRLNTGGGLAGAGMASAGMASGGLASAGLVAYGFALLAVMNAAVMNGLVVPTIFRQIAEPAASATVVGLWQAIARYNFAVNQAFSAVFAVGSSLAILAWSVCGWSGKLPRALAVYGCAIAPVTIALLFVGHLKLDVHGFGMVIFTQAAWFVIAGIALLRSNDGVDPVAV